MKKLTRFLGVELSEEGRLTANDRAGILVISALLGLVPGMIVLVPAISAAVYSHFLVAAVGGVLFLLVWGLMTWKLYRLGRKMSMDF